VPREIDFGTRWLSRNEFLFGEYENLNWRGIARGDLFSCAYAGWQPRLDPDGHFDRSLLQLTSRIASMALGTVAIILMSDKH
jgi:hypothetical protein